MYRAFKPRIVQQVAKSRRFLHTTPAATKPQTDQDYILGTRVKINRGITGFTGVSLGCFIAGCSDKPEAGLSWIGGLLLGGFPELTVPILFGWAGMRAKQYRQYRN